MGVLKKDVIKEGEKGIEREREGKGERREREREREREKKERVNGKGDNITGIHLGVQLILLYKYVYKCLASYHTSSILTKAKAATIIFVSFFETKLLCRLIIFN